MTKEQVFFLQLLDDHLHGRKTEAPAGLDWETLAQYAANHEVNGIVFYQCRAFLPGPAEKRLSEKYTAEIYYYYNRLALFKQVQQGLNVADIPYFTVKGIDVAPLYPVPALRTMGDCDIVVHPEDKEKAHDMMLSLGFENKLKEGIEWNYFKNDLEFEIHDHLLYEFSVNDKASVQGMDEAWAYTQPAGEGTRRVLDWSFHFVFLLLHLKKHLVGSGAGFRQFLDLAAVARKQELDWDWIRKTLEDLELLDFARVCAGLMERWFAVALPLDAPQPEEAFYDEATQKIFANGIFGFHDESNRENETISTFVQDRGPRWLIRLRRLLRSAFPPYRNIRYGTHYGFLNGRPWLLPAAWIYRFYRSIRYRMGARGKKMLDHAFIPAETLDERLRELEKWGLQ
ncbi:MAG: nucleotidyltransferase family protein [Oscillospiraceae bacterium]|nr:nucleotidyltransferase family protein [Oscillospiraceae bacterium]